MESRLFLKRYLISEAIVSLINVIIICFMAYRGLKSLFPPQIWIIFNFCCVCFTYIYPLSSYSYFTIKEHKDIDENQLEIMPYIARALIMSQLIYLIVVRILLVFSKFVSYASTAIVGLVIWIIWGRKDALDEGIIEFIESLKIARVVVEFYNFVDNTLNKLFNKLFEFEDVILTKFIKKTETDIYLKIPHAPKDPDKYNEQKREEYFENLVKAENGDPKAQIEVGNYLLNYGSAKEAVEWFFSAAELKEGNAFDKLGMCYMKGYGVDIDIKKAIGYYKQAVKYDDKEGMYDLANLLIKIPNKVSLAISLYTRSAKQNYEYAWDALGKIYFEGKYVDKNQQLSFYCLRKAVEENGLWSNALYLAKCYIEGIGTNVNERRGFTILKTSVEHGGDIDSLNYLAECYQNGIGVNKNKFLAKRYRNMAKEREKLLEDISDCLDKKP